MTSSFVSTPQRGSKSNWAFIIAACTCSIVASNMKDVGLALGRDFMMTALGGSLFTGPVGAFVSATPERNPASIIVATNNIRFIASIAFLSDIMAATRGRAAGLGLKATSLPPVRSRIVQRFADANHQAE